MLRSVLARMALGAMILTAMPAGLATADDASTYQSNPTHNGAVTLPGFRLPLQKAWETRLLPHISYPVIANGMVFVTAVVPSHDLWLPATNGTRLYALDLHTGAISWTRRIPASSGFSGLTYEAGRLFVVSYDGRLSALNPSTGDLLWTRKLSGQHDFDNAPTASAGVVYVAGAGHGATLYAVDELDGHVIWSKIFNGANGSSPALSSRAIFVSYPCKIYEFVRDTGAQHWRWAYPCDGGGGRTPVLYNDQIYFRRVDIDRPDIALAFKVQTGRLLWGQVREAIFAPVFWGDIGYFMGSKSLVARSNTYRTSVWRFNGDGFLTGAPLAINGNVVIGSSKGSLFILDGQSGSVLQTLSLPKGLTVVDEGNYSAPLTGFAAAEDTLIVPAGNVLTAFKGAAQ